MHIADQSNLFEPFKLGTLQLKNRIAMAPLTRARMGSDGVPTDMHAAYYGQRATAGLIISEATNISPQARGCAFTPGIWSVKQIAGWKKVTDAVHQAGGKIICQLWHVGRFGHTSLQLDGGAPVAPSAVKAEGMTFTEHGFQEVSEPRELRTDEIPQILEDYRHAAQSAKDAGFDGVEIHAANCFLLEQFIRDSVNSRNDQYGGTVENRTRLTLEVVDTVSSVWSDNGSVGIRLSPTTHDTGNTPLDSDVMGTYGYLIEKLNAYNLAYLHFVEGNTGGSRAVPDGVDLVKLRKLFKGQYLANNSYTLRMAIDAINSGHADVVTFGRPFIANPDLVKRLKEGVELAVAPNEAFYGGGEKGYTDWPLANKSIYNLK